MRKNNTAKKTSGKLSTTLVHGVVEKTNSSVAQPIYVSSTYEAETNEDIITNGQIPGFPRFYLRYGHPNGQAAAKLIASLEGAEDGLLTASGMGAISTAVLSLLKAGDHAICQTVHYGSALTLFQKILPGYGVDVSILDQTDVKAFEKAIKPNTKMIYLETPVNPLLTITDLKSIATIVKKRKILTLCDNTFGTPVNQNPIKLGIDIVIHSATKGLGGHTDLMAGAIVGPKKLISIIWEKHIVFGSVASPFDAWLLIRGMKTLQIRLKQQCTSTLVVAKFLEKHAAVKKVNYPGLPSHPQHKLAKSQMKDFGSILSFELIKGYEASEKFIRSLHYFKRAPSLGGVESLIIHPVGMLSKSVSPEEFSSKGVDKGLIRISIGLEDPQDLIDDISQALAKL